MTQKGIVIYAKPWQMQDERTGQNRAGISLEYLACENFEPVVNEDGSMGVRHCKCPSGIIKEYNQCSRSL